MTEAELLEGGAVFGTKIWVGEMIMKQVMFIEKA
jgi:hypothetical protein